MGWNKGFTKETHPSVLKISQTMKWKKIDNFRRWRDEMKLNGRIKNTYPLFPKNEFLAELIGVTLGDGHIQKFPRTERIIIAANSKNKGFIDRYALILEFLFNKKPTLMKSKNSNCVRISLYEKNISKRLGIPTGSRKNVVTKLPQWINKDDKLLTSCLRGLYEAEGSFCIHKPTSTYKIFFANKNDSLLSTVHNSVKKLGFNPNRSGTKIQISRKADVYKFKELINFRNYNNIKTH